jgi:hypothetical protein
MDEPSFVQEQARQQIEQDIQKRIQVHKANIGRLVASRMSAETLNVAVSNRPLVMLAQGDSWFDYPLTGNGLPLVDTDVIAQLRRIGGMPPTILNLAHHGEAAIDEMSLPKQERMISVLSDASNWLDGKPDAILFSAGGNDIAGDQFCIFLDFNDGHAAGLNVDRFTKARLEAWKPAISIFSRCATGSRPAFRSSAIATTSRSPTDRIPPASGRG